MDTDRLMRIAGSLATFSLVAACSTWDDMSQPERGTAVGSASGHVAGFVAGGPVGSAVGGAVGAAVGHQAAKANGTELHSGGPQPEGTDDRLLVLVAQQSLKEKGYDTGRSDGRWGPKTEEALRSFQSAHGIDATGQLDYPTMVALGIAEPSKDSAVAQ